MSFSRMHKWVTYLISGLGIYALTLGGELDVLSSVLLGVAFVASAFVEEPILSRPGWSRGWTIAVLGFFFLQILRGFLGGPILALGLEFAGFLQISRLFNRRTARDHQQIAVLAFLHLIAATVLSTDLNYGVVFLGFVVVTPWMLALSHLRREIEGNYPGVVERSGPDVRRVLASRRVVGPGFLAATAALTLPIFAVTVGLFLLFPRVGMGFLSFGTASGQRTAGFGSDIELGGFGVIRDDPTVVLRVTLPEGTGEEVLPLRLRGTSFDAYDGRRWTRSAQEAVSVGRMNFAYPVSRWPRPSDPKVQIDLDHLDEPVIFLPENTVALKIPPRVRGGMDTGREIFRSPGLDIRYLDDDALGLSYEAYIGTEDNAMLVEELSAAEREGYLSLPADTDPRIEPLAREVTAAATTDMQRAAAVERWLRDPDRFTYSLELPDTSGRDPLSVFLFDARTGHCEYYSTAMAVMLRAIGIPTRNVTGFVGGRFNPYGGYYAIRQGDAHSWVEAHVGDRWYTFDPTPAGRGALGPAEGLWSDLNAVFDAIRNSWSRDVIGYDLRTQAAGIRKLFQWIRSVRGASDEAASSDAPRASDRSSSSSGPVWALALVVLGVVAALTFAYLRRRRRRRAGGRRPDPPSVRDAVRVYRELERVLTKRGRPRDPATTPLEHVEALETERFAEVDAVREVTEQYIIARFGGGSLPRTELTRLRGLVERVRRG